MKIFISSNFKVGFEMLVNITNDSDLEVVGIESDDPKLQREAAVPSILETPYP